jgi:alpha-tubulin suppressor-like RCC1 family protein
VAGRPVIWSSLDPSVATVSAAGVVTGIAPGTAPIGAMVDGVQGGAFVTVVAPYPLVLGSPAVGDFHSCLLRTNNTVWCWGKGTLGQIGNGGNPTAQLVPIQVSGAFKALSAGRDQTCALDLGGGLQCWGDILGDNAAIGNNVPTPVPGGATFAKIFVGSFQACGLAADGTASCWGAAGRLGDGTNVNSLSPVLVVGGLKFATLAVGWNGACGLTQAGATWCWGTANSGSSLGDGATLTSYSPVPVAAGHQFTRITGGTGFQTCGIKANGEAWCWGRGSEGQLGDGSVANRPTPVKVATTVKFIAITAGGSHTCALAEDHTAWCWGLGGNLGSLAPTTLPLYVTTPIQVFGGRQFTEIDAGVGAHTCARAADGTWCWGSDLSGELGTGVAHAGTSGPPVKVRFP